MGNWGERGEKETEGNWNPGSFEFVPECPENFVLSDIICDIGCIHGEKHDVSWRLVDRSGSLLNSYLLNLISKQPTLPTSAPLVSAGDSTPRYSSLFQTHPISLSSDFNHPNEFSLYYPWWLFQNSLSFQVPKPGWTCTLAIRGFCSPEPWAILQELTLTGSIIASLPPSQMTLFWP